MIGLSETNILSRQTVCNVYKSDKHNSGSWLDIICGRSLYTVRKKLQGRHV